LSPCAERECGDDRRCEEQEAAGNFYPHNLQEFGYVVESADLARVALAQYLESDVDVHEPPGAGRRSLTAVEPAQFAGPAQSLGNLGKAGMLSAECFMQHGSLGVGSDT
jgi:hypothetical protein